MILHGGRVSPFVRRVELWLAAQQRPVERRYVSVFDPDFGGMLDKNPLGRVPVLELADGTCLFETSAIIDYLVASRFPALADPALIHLRRLSDAANAQPVFAATYPPDPA